MSPKSKMSIRDLSLFEESEESLVKKMISSILEKRGGRVLTINLDIFRQLYYLPNLRKYLAESTYQVADGWPIVLFSWLEKKAWLPRITGANLVLSLAKAATHHNLKIFLIGGAPLAAEKSRDFLIQLSEQKLKVDYDPLPSGYDEFYLNQLSEKLREFGPDLVFVAVGFPKAEELIEKFQPVTPTAWFIGVGISLSYLAGLVIRAPRWAQAVGIEWIFRLCQEPRRLFRRYILQDLPFLIKYFFSDFLLKSLFRK